MDEKLPVKRLNRLTWLQAMIIGFIFYLIVSHNGGSPNLIAYTLLTGSGILLVGYADVGCMIVLSKWYSIRSRKFSIYRRLLTYTVSVIIYLLLWPIFDWAANRQWDFLNFNLLLAFIGSGLVINTLITLLHDSVLLYEHKMNSELELSRLKAANAEATNLLLKQQIQPHFLFNALNTLKALYHKDTQAGDIYLVHMANFLRASVFHHASNISTLDDEVKLLFDYLEMQRIRFGAALNCTIILTEETRKGYSLPSFSLQPLLENAIKHNNFTQEDPLIVHISQQGDWLIITNNIQKKRLKVASTNYGLANLAERYKLWSGDEIIISEDGNSFSVSVKLLKNAYSNH